MEEFSKIQEHPIEPPSKKNNAVDVPVYLKKFYWWAYLHPTAVRIFERQWLVNSILWGNYRKLCNAVLAEIDLPFNEKMLQMACVYGDLTEKIASKLSIKGQLDIIDVSQVQLDNAKNKLTKRHNLNLLRHDSTAVNLPSDSYDVTLLFFLLHEQPDDARRETLSEAIRLTRKGGRIIIIDYHQGDVWNPLRYLMKLVFKTLEPFAQDFVNQKVVDLLPQDSPVNFEKQTFFGGLYQKLIISC